MKQSSKLACRLINQGYMKVTVDDSYAKEVLDNWSSVSSLFAPPERVTIITKPQESVDTMENKNLRELQIDNMILTVENKAYLQVIKKQQRRIGDLEGRTSRLFTTKQIADIMYLYECGYTQKFIAEMLDTSHQRISDVVNGVIIRGKDHDER